MDAPAGVTQQEEGYTGFLYLPSAVRALILIARRIQPSNFCPLVHGKEVEFLCRLKKNQTAPRPSEHPPVMGEKCQNV